MTVHVLHAGDGYTYLTRQVASGDHQLGRGQDLADYYTAQGNPPGRWIGSGLSELGVSGRVSESQMRALFGEGAHPDRDDILARREALYVAAGEDVFRARELARRDAQLGRRFPTYSKDQPSWGELLKRAYAAEAGRRGVTSSDLDPDQRATVRVRVARLGFSADHGRMPTSDHEVRSWIASRSRPARQAVAGYDLVFTPVKSVSVLWALAPAAVRVQVAQAHEAAVLRALSYIEEHAAKTRTGTGGIAQIDTHGLVAAAFDHRDSRTGDPNLHTHVAVSTKVRGVDGVWRSLDGRVLFALAVSASEVYTTAVEDELRDRLGVRFEGRRTGRRDTREVREIAGIDPRLLTTFASRRAAIERAYDEKLARYRSQYGHDPDRSAQARLAQEATLSTRTPKGAPSALAEQRMGWLRVAAEVCDIPMADVEQRIITDVRAAAAVRPHNTIQTEDLAQLADRVVERVSRDRSTWTRWHIRAEAERQLRQAPVANPTIRETQVDRLTDQALAASINLTPPPFDQSSPATLRRANGESVFTVHGSALYTSREVLDAETRLLEAGQTLAVTRISSTHVAAATAGVQATTGRTLGAEQIAFADHLATSSRLLALGIGPAGSGKTTALRVLAAAAAAAGVRVIALAPSARAASVLSDELGVHADTIHKYLHDLDRNPDNAPLRQSDVLLVDEAGMAGTLRLSRLARHAAERGAVIRLVGDPRQLAAVEAGGALRLLASELPAAQLSELHRFVDADEAAATLKLRDGDQEAIDFYDDRGRLSGGTLTDATEAMYGAWLADTNAGRTSLMVTTRTALVVDLSARARLDRISQGLVDPRAAVRLHDGTSASPGDLVVTRRNDRMSTVHSGRDFVKNGDVWRVEAAHDDGRLGLIHVGHRGRVTLTRDYASSEVELAYATTVHRAQGVTVDTAHVLVDHAITREPLYVAATRGRESNHLYAVTDHAIDVDFERPPKEQVTAREVVCAAIERIGAERSATQTLRENLDGSESLARLVPEYQHVHELRVRQRADIREAVVRVLGSELSARVFADRAWSTAAAVLSQAVDAGRHPVEVLQEAATSGRLDDTTSPALLLSWRMGTAEGRTMRAARRESGLPCWLPPPPPASKQTEPETRLENWLWARAEAIRERLDLLLEEVTEAPPPWLKRLPGVAADLPLLREVAAFRDEHGIVDPHRPLGLQPLRRGAGLDLWRSLTRRLESACGARDQERPQDVPTLQKPVVRLGVRVT